MWVAARDRLSPSKQLRPLKSTHLAEIRPFLSQLDCDQTGPGRIPPQPIRGSGDIVIIS